MTLTELQNKLNELAGDDKTLRAHPGYTLNTMEVWPQLSTPCYFNKHEGTQHVGDRVVKMLHEARDLIDRLIVKVEVAQREPVKVSVKSVVYRYEDVNLYPVGDEWRVDEETYLKLVDAVNPSDGNKNGLNYEDNVLHYFGAPVVCKPELD